MRKIYKYLLEHSGSHNTHCIISMPKDSELLTIQLQHGEKQLWALVDPNQKELEDRHFLIFGTGHEIKLLNNIKYIATVQEMGGGLVWHIFEIIL